MAALMIGGHQFCAATVIGERAALTAAHCQVDPSTDTLLVGTQDLTIGGRRIGITQARNHWRWTSTTSGHDVSVLILAEPADVPAVQLARVTPNAGSVIVYGWGRTSEGGPSSSTLLQARLPVVPWFSCWNSYPLALDDTMFCAGAEGLDSCHGDSGGPVMLGAEQAGIVSWGHGCARDGYPGVNTAVASVLDWIAVCAQ
jgi:secreted trypsin-like serine protease